MCRVARSGCIRWAAKWTELTVARGCRQCGSAQRARSHASARRSPPRRQPAYSTIDVLLSTEVGMVQAPYGTTRVRASGVLSHPLASERGSYLFSVLVGQLYSIFVEQLIVGGSPSHAHTHARSYSHAHASPHAHPHPHSLGQTHALPSRLYRVAPRTQDDLVDKAHACVQRREAILRAVRQSPTGLAMSGDGWDYDRQSLRGTSSQAPCPGLGPTEERTHTLRQASLSSLIKHHNCPNLHLRLYCV